MKPPPVYNDKKEIADYIREKTWKPPKSKCVIWQGDETNTGYGKMRIEGSVFAVRRVIWWLEHGYLPQGSHMSDTCGEKGCCNIEHIRDATPEIERRKTLFRSKKRFNGRRISMETAALVWQQLLLDETTIKAAARKYGTSPKTMRKHVKKYESGL